MHLIYFNDILTVKIKLCVILYDIAESSFYDIIESIYPLYAADQ